MRQPPANPGAARGIRAGWLILAGVDGRTKLRKGQLAVAAAVGRRGSAEDRDGGPTAGLSQDDPCSHNIKQKPDVGWRDLLKLLSAYMPSEQLMKRNKWHESPAFRVVSLRQSADWMMHHATRVVPVDPSFHLVLHRKASAERLNIV